MYIKTWLLCLYCDIHLGLCLSFSHSLSLSLTLFHCVSWICPCRTKWLTHQLKAVTGSVKKSTQRWHHKQKHINRLKDLRYGFEICFCCFLHSSRFGFVFAYSFESLTGIMKQLLCLTKTKKRVRERIYENQTKYPNNYGNNSNSNSSSSSSSDCDISKTINSKHLNK